MDVDETFWTEEPVTDEQKRSQDTYTEEFVPRIDQYLERLLNYEGVLDTTTCRSCRSAPFEWRCSDCFPALVLCKGCCRNSHRQLPFHRVQKWTGKYFIPSWLREVGVSLHLGHSGDLCPIQSMDREEYQEGSYDEDDIAADPGFGGSKPGHHDKEGNPIITVVDRSGVHEIGVSWCRCPEAAEHDMQLMMAGLFPATFRNPKTAFTFRVLEEFHLDNLECKTTPSQFFSRLRRLTSNEFPNTVPDRYRELLRLSRQWRVLTSRKRFGFGYEANEEQKPGSMAIFCALCAQPGINIPEDWKEYENSKSLFMRGFIMDGNFQAEHMKMRNPENDIPLSDGTGFMVSPAAYELHLKSAVERRQRSTCHDHRAVNNVNKHNGHLQSTGIGATACVHGNFVPDCVVDFQKGEAQKNMDYSIFKALNFNMEGIEAALICYDVMCQWSVHAMERVNRSSYLKLPDNLELRLAIGLFHIHGHQDTCLARFSPSFIEGGRQIDGETIETLWAPLNEISRSTRGMSTSHRREVIDDHMNDSNWKKLIDIGNAYMGHIVNSLPTRYRKALSGAMLSVAAFESINSSASSESVEAWSTQEVQAQQERAQDVTAMDIYDIKMKRLPSRAEILLESTEKEIDTSGRKGHSAWLASGLRIQEMQLSLQALVRMIGTLPTPDQQRDITLKRARLQERIDTFQKQTANFIHASADGDDDSWEDASTSEVYTGVEFDGIDEEEEDQHTPSTSGHGQMKLSGRSGDAEHFLLHLPSHLGHDWCNTNAAEDLAKVELDLRQGQLNDSLHHIRIALGHKSYLFRNNVRPARTQRLKTRAWGKVHAAESTLQHHARVYMCARQAIVNLGASTFLLDRYKVLTRQDLSVKTSIIAPQVRGQRNQSLPWFWTMDVRGDADEGEWMEDFYRVHWLRARAQKMRWIEELQCLQVEMGSTVRFFRHQEQFWQAKQELIEPKSQPGHAAWAARQSAMWSSMAMQAESKFTALLNSDPPPEFAKVIPPQLSSYW
ncbi:hypothetical protein EDB84DRAFT_1567796 [Lactarius hengduanensis]|nr:hypothetical protein EDB84DRAFT_1567796 [Lactarius hengduanensis]